MNWSNRRMLYAVVLCYFFYLCLRAWKLPLTTDEGTTWFNYVPLSVRDLLAYTNPVPNNHLLNTLLIQFFSQLFSPHQFTLRLPALLGGAAYLIGTVGIARQFRRRVWMQWLAVALLLGNHFVTDFLSLARGYGISTGLALLAMWQALLFLRHRKVVALIGAMVWAVLSVLASFTALNFFIPFVILLLIVIYQHAKYPAKSGLRKEPLWWQVGIVVVASAALATLCYLPIRRMSETEQFRFWSVRSFWQDTLLQAVQDFRYHKEILGEHTPVVLAVLVVMVFVLAGFFSMRSLIHQEWKAIEPLVFVWLVLAGTVLMTVLQAWLVKTPYLSGRTALIFYPLFALNCIFLMKGIGERHLLLQKGISLLFAGLLCGHFLSCMNLQSCKEWWFDAHTFEVLDYLKAIKLQRNDCRRITLASYWVTNNSLSFAIQYQYEDYIEPLVWKDRSDPNETAEFVYTELQEIPVYETKYEVVWQRPESGRYLLQRKKD